MADTTSTAPDALDPQITKAKLFTVAGEDGAWTEIGVGVVAIVAQSDDEGDNGDTEKLLTTTAASGAVGNRMTVVSIEEDGEVLMSTPLVPDDVYVVQHDSILVWSDPEIAREMALSFNTSDGCKKIVAEIMKFQAACRAAGAPADLSSRGVASGDARDEDGGKALARNASGVSASSSAEGDNASPWSVCRENLPTIALALRNNAKRLGMHIRDHPTFAAELVKLYRHCDTTSDLVGREHMGRIVVSLLGPPFNSEGKILSQLIDNDVIDTTIDIVQFALGRRTPLTGFVDAQRRKAAFRNPCELGDAVVSKIHVLQSCQYLKDLLPLFLDEGDAVGASLLGTFLLRFKFGVVGEVCRSQACLPAVFCTPSVYQSVDRVAELVRFLHDLSKTIKNSMVPLDVKDELFEELMQRGVLEFIRRLAATLMRRSCPASSSACDVLAMLCDIIAHMAMFAASTRSELLADAQRANDPPLFLQVAQPEADSGVDDAVATPAGTSPESLWQDALAVPPTVKLLDVMIDLVIHGAVTSHSALSQAAYDMLYSCGIGLLQGAALQAMGVNIHPKRRHLLRIWMERDAMMLAADTSASLKQSAVASGEGGDDAPSLLHGDEPSAAVGCCSSSSPTTNAPEPHADWPAFYRLLFTFASEVLSPSAQEHRHRRLSSIHYLLRAMLPLCRDAMVYQHANFAVMLVASGALHAVRIVLCEDATAAMHCVRGAVRNAQSTAMAWLAALLQPCLADINTCILDAGVLPAVMKTYLAHFGVRHCVLSSNAANVLHAVHNSLHVLKGTASSAGPSPSRVSAALRNPFLRSLGRDDGLDSDGSSTVGNATNTALRGPLDTRLASFILHEYGSVLSSSERPALRLLAEKLRRVLSETPEEALEDLSSRATSTTVERVVISTDDFNALLAEYGPDAPISESMIHDAAGPEVCALAAHVPTGDDDEEVSALQEDPDGSGGFLLKRRRQSQSPRATSPQSDIGSDSADADDNKLERKRARSEGPPE